MVGQIEWLWSLLAGYWNPNNKKFNNVDKGMNCWLADGNYANFNKNKWNGNNITDDYFFSVRLLKNWIPQYCGKKMRADLPSRTYRKGRSAFALGLFYIDMIDSDQLLLDLFQAYYDTRQHKRTTRSAVAFEMNYETKLFALHADLINGTYVISPSICFIIKDPVQREIFAADFRDRIVHHLIYNYIYELFDHHFIYDSYSCRLGKGTHFGIKRVNHFIRSCTHNYSRDAYILKLDVKGFFMHIDKTILFETVKTLLQKKKNQLTIDYDFLLQLIYQVISHDSTHGCMVKGQGPRRGKKTDWHGLPDDKSLFHSLDNTGLAIGNLTSQLFANIYLDSLDKYIKYDLGFRYYGRYVDDFIIVDTDKQKVLSAIPLIKSFLHDQLHLTLHPKKIYFQQYSKGVQFLGAYIKPHRTYICKKTIGKFWQKIQEINKTPILDMELTQSIANSYLGTLSHYKTYNIRKKVINAFSNRFRSRFHFTYAYEKVVPNIRKLKASEIRNLYPQGYYHGNIR